MRAPRMLELDESCADSVGIPRSAFRQLLELSKLLEGEITWMQGSHCPTYSFRKGKAYIWTTQTLDEIRELHRHLDEKKREKAAEGKSREQIAGEMTDEFLAERGSRRQRSWAWWRRGSSRGHS